MPRNPTAQTRPVHFLVVEDDEDHAELILGVLAEHTLPHQVDHLADGSAALAYLDAVKAGSRPMPDIVLLDLKLPKVDGIAVLRHIKQDPALCALPVVVLTTSDAEVDRLKAYHSYANSYLVKPVNYEKFEALIEELSTYWGEWNYGPK